MQPLVISQPPWGNTCWTISGPISQQDKKALLGVPSKLDLSTASCCSALEPCSQAVDMQSEQSSFETPVKCGKSLPASFYNISTPLHSPRKVATQAPAFVYALPELPPDGVHGTCQRHLQQSHTEKTLEELFEECWVALECEFDSLEEDAREPRGTYSLSEKVRILEHELAKYDQALYERDGIVTQLEQALDAATSENKLQRGLVAMLQARDRELTQLLERRLADLEQQVQQRNGEIAILEQALADATAENQLQRGLIDGMRIRQAADFQLHKISLSDVRFNEQLAAGGFGSVHRCEWQGTCVAAKCFRLHECEPHQRDSLSKSFREESRILLNLRSPHIVQAFGFCTCAPDEPFILMELCGGGSVRRMLDDASALLNGERLKRLGFETAKGVSYLHNQNLVHRDLKSHNVLIGSHGEAKVADLGIATPVGGPRSCCGTPAWMAPEALLGCPAMLESDVWSFGVFLWELVTRQLPFHGLSTEEVIHKVCVERAGLHIPVGTPTARLIASCWSRLEGQRPTFKRIVDILGPRDAEAPPPFMAGSSQPMPVSLPTLASLPALASAVAETPPRGGENQLQQHM